MKKNFQILQLCFWMTLMTISCRQYSISPEVNINPEFGIPVLRGKISLNKILQKEKDSTLYLSAGEDGIIHLKVNKMVDTLTIDKIFKNVIKNDTLINEKLLLPSLGNQYYISGEINFSLILDSVLHDIRIDSIKLNSGMLELTFNTLQQYETTLSFVLPNITYPNKKPVTVDNFIPVAGNNKTVINLNNTLLKITKNERGEKIVVVKVVYYVRGKGQGNNTKPPEIQLLLRDLDVNFAYGKIGGYSIELDSIETNLFSTNPLSGGKLEFDLLNPDIKLVFKNGFGVPFLMIFDKFGIVENPGFKPFTGYPNSWFIDAPGLNSSFKYKTNFIQIAKTNNFLQLLSRFPSKIIFDGQLLINPYNPDQPNYIRETDSLMIGMTADLPLNIKISTLHFPDTLEFDGSKLKDLSSARFNLYLKNYFPVNVNVQGYFADLNYKIIDSLFVTPVMINSRNQMTGGTDNFDRFQSVNFTNDRLSKIRNSTFFRINSHFVTVGSDQGKYTIFYMSQFIEFKLDAFGKMHLNIGGQ